MKSSLLWKFYKNDQNACHYIFGTMHLATSSAYSHADLAMKYIDKVSQYAGEMDLNAAKMENISSHFLFPEGQTLSSLFTPRHYNKYVQIIERAFGINLLQYENFIPFFITSLMAEKNTKSDKKEALDHYLWNFALEKGKKMTGVETFEDQAEILRKIPMDYQIKSLKDSLRNVDAFKNKISALNTMYENAELNLLYKSSKKKHGFIKKSNDL